MTELQQRILREEFYQKFGYYDWAEYPGDLTDYADHWLSKLSTIRKETIERCQKEMYQSLGEVAQYGNNLVNKRDIKVWIHALPSSFERDIEDNNK